MPAPFSGTVLRITQQSSCVVANLVFAAKPQEPQDDTKRHLFTIALAIPVLVHGVIEWGSKEKDEPFGRSPQPWWSANRQDVLMLAISSTSYTWQIEPRQHFMPCGRGWLTWNHEIGNQQLNSFTEWIIHLLSESFTYWVNHPLINPMISTVDCLRHLSYSPQSLDPEKGRSESGLLL
jgi:hypothetical protein